MSVLDKNDPLVASPSNAQLMDCGMQIKTVEIF